MLALILFNCLNATAQNTLIKQDEGQDKNIQAEINAMLWSAPNKPISDRPDWTGIKTKLSDKYDMQKVKNCIITSQVYFYLFNHNWSLLIKSINTAIKQSPPKSQGKAFNSLLWGAQLSNTYCDPEGLNKAAWAIFQGTAKKRYLKSALKWSDLSVRLEGPSIWLSQYLDTKSNILYRLGKIEKALDTENEALIANRNTNSFISDFNKKSFEETIKKMKLGVPTWIPDK